jgi:rRNA-processing protein FCF1
MIERTERLKLIFDTCSLITASKFRVDGKLIIDYFLEIAEIHIPEEVCFESIKELHKYVDAREIKMAQAVQSRYDKGFINHTISMIERSDI